MGWTLLKPLSALAETQATRPIPQAPPKPIPPPLTAAQPLSAPQAAAQVPAFYSATSYGVQLGQGMLSALQTFAGGDVTGDVVAAAAGADKIQHKHIGNLRYVDLVLTCDADMSKDFYAWEKATFKPCCTKMELSSALTLLGVPSTPLYCVNGLITEVGFPALDGSANSPAAVTVKVAPETETTQPASGSLSVANPATKRSWLRNGFRLQIAGCENFLRVTLRLTRSSLNSPS